MLGIAVRLTLVSAAAAAARAQRVFSLLFEHVTPPVTDTSHTCHYRRRRRRRRRPAAILLAGGDRGLRSDDDWL